MAFDGLRRFFRLDRTADVDRAVNDELEFHFEHKVRELMERGMSEPEARLEAERRFGDVERTRARLAAIDRGRVGGERRAEWWSGFGQDLRYALRGLRLKPGFTAGVVVTLALGIGANATMFGIVDRLMFRPPAGLARPDEVNRVYFIRTFDGVENASPNTSYKRYTDLRELAPEFPQIAAVFVPKLAIGTGEESREMSVQAVSASFFPLFEVRPAIGRFFSPDEDTLPGTPVTVLDYGFWQTQYGGRQSALGSRLHIGKQDYTIIGVAPRGFMGLEQQAPAAWIPATSGIAESGGINLASTYGWQWPAVIVRRAPGMSVEAATSILTSVYQRSYERQALEQRQLTPASLTHPHAVAASVMAERGPRQSNETKVAKWLIGVAAIVLIIACANVGNLLLARAFGRRREIAVRLALGISRRRLLAQLLTESVLLALFGGLAGVAVAQWGGGLLRASLMPDVAWGSTLGDTRVLGFSLGVALVAGLLAGLAPAIHAGRSDVAASLKAGVREGTYHRSRIRTSLLILQGALSVVLLVGAGLFVRSFHTVKMLPLGFDSEQLLTVGIQMRGITLDTAAAVQLRERLMDAARTVPGVERATRALTTPFYGTWSYNIVVPGLDTAYLNNLDVSLQAASPGYFQTMGTALLRGREPGAEDRLGAPLVMVVSQSLAKALWKDRDPLGQCVRIGSDTVPCHTVIGVAEDIKHNDFKDDPGLNYYLSSAQWYPARGGIIVRTTGSAAASQEAVRRALQAVMPSPAYVTVNTLTDILAHERRQWELGATMFSIFGILAVVVAAVGLYSVVAYGVAQRSHELGVRVALGAQTNDVIRLVLGEALFLSTIAATIGTVLALIAGRWVKPLLFETSEKDPAILGAVALALLFIATMASLVPALRAARTDPNVALRAD